jgi:hypothetical protein
VNLAHLHIIAGFHKTGRQDLAGEDRTLTAYTYKQYTLCHGLILLSDGLLRAYLGTDVTAYALSGIDGRLLCFRVEIKSGASGSKASLAADAQIRIDGIAGHEQAVEFFLVLP